MVDTPQTSPRGTDRIRRRAAQAEHKVQASLEAAALTAPEGPEKVAAIEKNKQIARFGAAEAAAAGGIRKVRQARNRQRAEEESASLGAVELSAPRAPKLIPGQQVDLRTANLQAQADDISERDYTTEAAREAGLAVRDTLRGKPLRDRHNRSRHIARHNAEVARRAATAQ